MCVAEGGCSRFGRDEEVRRSVGRVVGGVAMTSAHLHGVVIRKRNEAVVHATYQSRHTTHTVPTHVHMQTTCPVTTTQTERCYVRFRGRVSESWN